MRLIDADALHDDIVESYMTLHKFYETAQDEQTIKNMAAQLVAFAEFAMRVKATPTIDAEPVRHGRWDVCDTKENGRGIIELCGTDWLMCIRQQGATYDMIINHCGDQISIPIEFCPDRGAKLDADPKPQEPRKVCPATGLECIECVPGYGCAKTEGGASDENA